MLLTQATFYVLIIIGNIVTASTPECLPRDVVAAGRPCARACSQDGTCRKKNKECICDGLCGLSCLRKRCPTLTAPLNGNMVVNPTVRPIGAEVTYSCNDGYVLFGQRNRICQANKTWSGTEPMCTDSTTEVPSQECAERDTAAAGRNCGKACQPDSTCIKDNRECVCDGLCGLTCLKKRCPPLPTPRNGSFVINPDDRTIGAEVTYSCNNGYIISGRENRICQANKTWSGTQPTCTQPTTEVPCPILDLEDGALAYLDNKNQRIFEPHHGDIRVAVCNDGRLLRGTSQTRCISGSWQHALPSCEVEPCSVASLERYNTDIQYAVPPGSNEIEAGLKPAGTTANFICRQYGFEASQTKRCERGRWRGADPVCLRIPCDDELLENGDFTYTLNGVQYEEPVHGVVRSYNCYAGYTVEDDRPSQCDAGSWTRGLSNCIERPCNLNNLLSAEWNIVYNYPGGRDESAEVMKSPGTVASFTCSRIGYVTVGHNTRTCRHGEWNGQNPFCERIRCPTTQLDNGVLEYRNIDSRVTMEPKHNDFRIATCNRGYDLQGAEETRCFVGEWEDELPICLEVFCRIETIANGDITRQDGSQFTQDARHDEWRRVTCKDGYTLVGDMWSSCRNGQWSENPTCEENECSAVVNNGEYERILYHGVPSDAQSFLSNTVLEVDCAEGRVPEGPRISFCRRGVWDPPRLLCVHTGCSTGCEVPHLENGYFTLHTAQGQRLQPRTCVSLAEHVYVHCQQGLIRRGSYYYTCQRSGEWFKVDGDDATCHTCPETQCVVPHVENGYYTSTAAYRTPLTSGTCTPYGVIYLYLFCEDGMQRVGQRYYSCTDGELVTGNPGNSLSTCIREEPNEQERSCPSPEVVNLVETFVGSDYTPLNGQETFSEGDVITSRCQNAKSQQFYGSVTRRCGRGQWSGDRPRCESTNFVISVGNTALQNITENGTIIVYPISGFVTINCKLVSNVRHTINMYKNNEEIASYRDRREFNLERLKLTNPSEANSGTYKCESNRQSLSIDIIFKDIRCPYPGQPNLGSWRHHRAVSNPGGILGFIFMETVSLNCPRGYRASDSTRAQCSYHGTWTNPSQTCIRI